MNLNKPTKAKRYSPIKAIAVIPCYNVAKTIQGVVKGTLQYVDMVFVVDNFSDDSTWPLAAKAGANIRFCRKRGMGISTSIGIAEALEYKPNFIVTLDGDGQHDPTEIPKLLKPLLDNKCDIVVGIRLNNQSMPPYRRFGNRLITLAFSLGAKFQLPDAQCGLRAFTAEVAESIKTKEHGFGCITEFLIKARKGNYRIVGIPVSCIYHANLKDNSTMNPLTHGLGVFLSTIRWRIWEILK